MNAKKPAKGIPVSSRIPTSGQDSGTHSRSSSVSNLTSASDIPSEAGDAMSETAHGFILEDRVWVNGTKPGCIKFLGKTQFAPGVWAGVRLDDPVGKNDGSVGGVKYFTCEPLRGIFARPQKLTRSCGPISGTGDTSSCAGSPRGSTCSINVTTPPNRGVPSASLLSSGTRACSRLRIGERIMVSSTTGDKTGILRFLGETDFAKGEWAGIELDEPVGKNDGSVAGKRYFSCAMKYGLFSPLHKVSRAGGTSTPRSTSIRGTPIMRSTSRDSLSSSVSNSSKASGRVKLGVTALTNSKPKSRSTGMGLMTTSRALEETLKEKEQHIEQLLKEHELGRTELAQISGRCKEAETLCFELQKQQKVIEAERKNVEEQLCADKRKLEDLQFQLEEEKITKSEIEMQLEQQKHILKRIEEYIVGKFDEKFINIKEILDGKENLSEISETQETESQAVNGKINALEASLKNALTERNKSMKELEDLKSQLKEERKNESSTLNITIQEKDDVISNLKNELNSQLEKVTQLMEDNRILNEQISLHAAEAKGHTDEVIKEMGQKIKLLSEDLISKNSRLQEFENSVQEKDNKISSLEKSLEAQVEQLTQITNQNQTLQNTLNQKTIELTEKLTLQKSLEEEMSTMKSLVETEISNNKEKILGLVKEIEHITGSLQEREDELALKQTEITTLNVEIEELTKVCSQVQMKLKKAEENISSSNQNNIAKIATLENEIQQLKEEKENIAVKQQKELEVKQTEFGVLCQELETMKTLLPEKESQILQLTGMLNEKDSDYSNTQTDLAELKQSCKVLNEEKTNLISTLQTKENLISELEKQLQDLRNIVNEKSKEVEEIKKSTDSLKDVLRQKEEKNFELNSQLQVAEQSIEMLKKSNLENVTALQEELSKLRDSTSETKTDLEQKLAKLEEQNEIMAKNIGEKDVNLEEKEKILSELQNQVKSKENDVFNLSSLVEKLENEVSALSNNKKEIVETLGKQLETSKDEFICELKKKELLICDFEKQVQDLQNLLTEKSKEIEEIKKLMDASQDLLRQKEEENIKLNSKLQLAEKNVEMLNQDSSQHVMTLQNELSRLKDESIKTKTSLEQQLSEMQEENRNQSNIIDEANSAVVAKNEMMSVLQNQLKAKEDEIDALSDQVEKLKQELEALSKGKEEMQLYLEKHFQAVKNEFSLELEKKEEILNEGQLKISKSNEIIEAKDHALSQKDAVIDALKAAVREKESQFDELSQMIEASQAKLVKVNEQNEKNVKLLESKETFMNEFKAEKEKHLLELQENCKQYSCRLDDAVIRHENEIKCKDDIIFKLNAKLDEQKNQMEILNNELQKTKASYEIALQNTSEIHKDFNTKIADLEAKYAMILEEKEKIQDKENKTKGEMKNLETARDSLLKEKIQQEEVVKDKEAKLEALQAEVMRMQVEFTRHKQDLDQKLDVSEMEKEATLELKTQLELQHSVLEELQQELQNSNKKNEDLELQLKNMSSLTTENTELLNKLTEFEKLDKEKSERILDIEEKYRVLEELFGNNQNCLQAKEVECLSLSDKVQCLQSDKENSEHLKSSFKSLEQENILLKHRIEKLETSVPEKKLPGQSESKSNENQMDSDDRESLISQVDFLNSIIVDMKQKNENLQQEIEVFKMGPPIDIDLNLNDVRKKVAPRLFCDICDMFDLHDTDDCPKQASFIEDEAVPHLIPQGTRELEERPYCNNCEIFGHWTLECEEQETY